MGFLDSLRTRFATPRVATSTSTARRGTGSREILHGDLGSRGRRIDGSCARDRVTAHVHGDPVSTVAGLRREWTFRSDGPLQKSSLGWVDRHGRLRTEMRRRPAGAVMRGREDDDLVRFDHVGGRWPPRAPKAPNLGRLLVRVGQALVNYPWPPPEKKYNPPERETFRRVCGTGDYVSNGHDIGRRAQPDGKESP